MRLRPIALYVALALALMEPLAGASAEMPITAASGSIIFASDADGDGDLYRLEPDGSLTNLTANREPDWSPAPSGDGKRLAFVSRRDGNSEIYLMALPVGNVLNVTNDPAADYEPDWDPDGRSLVFVSERDGGRDLYLLEWARGTVTRLTTAAPGEIYRSPRWSPDGGSIAYSAVRGGVEQVYVLHLESGVETQVTDWPLKGRFPSWSPDGSRLAFAGWHDDDRPGVYIVSRYGADLEWIWEARSAIRGLAWAGDSVLLSRATDRGADIVSVSLHTGEASVVVGGFGWSDCPSAEGGAPAAVSYVGREREPTAKRVPAVLGANIADLSNAHLLHQLGFGWLKNYLSWAGTEPEPGQYRWEDADNVVKAGETAGLAVLMRLHDTPEWARPAEATVTHPPQNLEDYRRFVTEVARRYRGRVAAYEIGNEPNLFFEWGGLDPDPAGYVEMLRVAYGAIKAEDPEALVVTGGLSTTGDGGDGAMGDLEFIRGMYEAGAQGYFDALGSHPYGFGLPPFREHPWGLSVARLEQQRAVMVVAGDGDTPIWATEVGWPVASPWEMGEHDEYSVTEAEQAFYYQQLILQAAQSWPWLEGVFIFNLDFSTVAWYDAAQPMRWYALLEGDGSPRLAFSRLRGIGRLPQ